MRRALILSLLVPASLLSFAGVAAADDPLKLTAFSGVPVPTTVDLPTGHDGQVDFSAMTSGTNPATAVSVSVAGQSAPLSTSDNTSWSGPVTIPATTKAAPYTATATASNGSEQDTATASITVRTEPVITLAFTPTLPRAGGSYTVYGSIREPDGAGGLVGMAGTLTLTGPGYSSTFAVSSSGAFHHAVTKALPATWTVSFAASGYHLATSTSATLSSVSANATRFVSFDAGPEPAYLGGQITVRGYLQRYSPTLARWVAYGGQLVTISRYSPSGFVTHRTTTSTGYFAAVIRGANVVETAAWHASYGGYRVGSTLVNAPSTSTGDAVATTFAPLRLTRAYYNPPGTDTLTNAQLNREYVVITNEGTRVANLYRWVVRDFGPDHAYEFPTAYLAPGHSLVLHTGQGTNGGGHYYWGLGNYVWNNSGDTAYLQRYYDNRTVDSCSWGAGSGVTNC